MLDESERLESHFHIKVASLKVKLECDFCVGCVNVRPNALKFANLERFFCFAEPTAS